MATQLADAQLADPRRDHAAVQNPFVAHDSDPTEAREQAAVAHGIIAAILISVPLWALIAFTVYMLL